MNVTFHVVGNTADEVRAAANNEVARFFPGRTDLTVDIHCDATETNTSHMAGQSLIRSGYYCTVNVRERAA